MTAPNAIRQRVAVKRIEYSTGRLRAARAAIRHPFYAPARIHSGADKLAEAVAALLVVAKLVVGGAGRRQQHHLPGLGGGPRGLHGGGQVATAVERHAA